MNKSENKKNVIMKFVFAGLFAFVLVFAVNAGFAKAELNLSISGQIGSLTSDFHAITNPDSKTGFDGFDLVVPSKPSGDYASFYSDFDGNQLAVDSWPNSSNPRELNLTFITGQDLSAGDLILNWSYADHSHFKITLYDYGGDLDRANQVSSIDLGSASSHIFRSTSGVRYFTLVVENVAVSSGNENSSVVGNSGGTNGGGGGGGGEVIPLECRDSILCNDWNVCQNLQKSYLVGVLKENEFNSFKDQCTSSGLALKDCGFQTRDCRAVSVCNGTFAPSTSQSCQFVENPSCSDGVKDCHDGKCEVLTDCGGPCHACATCNDGIQNQGEEGIDCGGPCPTKCSNNVFNQVFSSKSNGLIYFYICFGLLLTGLLVVLLTRLTKLVVRKGRTGRDESLKWYKLR